MKIKTHLKKVGTGFGFYIPVAFINMGTIDPSMEYELEIRPVEKKSLNKSEKALNHLNEPIVQAGWTSSITSIKDCLFGVNLAQRCLV